MRGRGRWEALGHQVVSWRLEYHIGEYKAVWTTEANGLLFLRRWMMPEHVTSMGFWTFWPSSCWIKAKVWWRNWHLSGAKKMPCDDMHQQKMKHDENPFKFKWNMMKHIFDMFWLVFWRWWWIKWPKTRLFGLFFCFRDLSFWGSMTWRHHQSQRIHSCTWAAETSMIQLCLHDMFQLCVHVSSWKSMLKEIQVYWTYGGCPHYSQWHHDRLPDRQEVRKLGRILLHWIGSLTSWSFETQDNPRQVHACLLWVTVA